MKGPTASWLSLLLLAFCCTLAAFFTAQPACAHTIERVSVASDGTQGDAASFGGSMSADGRFVAFGSLASNLVPGGANGWGDVFVHDRATARTERVSVASDGSSGNAFSAGAHISADGRFVVFHSDASNLVSHDTNGACDLFTHDRLTRRTERVSVASDGSEVNTDSQDFRPCISADGRFVTFSSEASTLVPGDANGCRDIFLHDRATGVTERLSVGCDGNEANADSYNSSMSADARFVAFDSYASNLVPGDTNGVVDSMNGCDIFVHDRATGRTERVSVASDGSQGNDWSDYLSISADGRFVAFESFASNLVPGDTNGWEDVFVHDRATGVTERVSVASDGTQGDAASFGGSMSADGRFVAFGSLASNLVPGGANGWGDVFVHDRATGITERLSLADGGSTVLSADWRFVAFQSDASLVPGDTNGTDDVFVVDRYGYGGPPGMFPDTPWCADWPSIGPVYHYPTQLHAHYRCERLPGTPGAWGAWDMTPKQLAQRYRNQGYSFTAATEHWQANGDFSWDKNFWNTAGAEDVGRICDSFEDTANTHILGIGFNHNGMDMTYAGKNSHELERVQAIVGRGGIAIAAHPNEPKYAWQDWVLRNCVLNASLTGVEIFNAGTFYVRNSAADGRDKWDMLLGLNKPIWGTAGDDFTTPWPQFDDGCVVIVSASPSLTTQQAVNALKRGAFYASKGPCLPGTGAWHNGNGAPIIEGWWAESATGSVVVHLVIRTWEPVVRFVSNGRAYSGSLTVRGDGDYEATFTYSVSTNTPDGYVRAEVSTGGYWPAISWTQPIFIGRQGIQTYTWTPQAAAAGRAVVPPVVIDFDQAHLEISQPQTGLAGTVNAYLLAPEDRPTPAPPMGYVGPCYRFLPAAQLQGSNLLRLGYDPREVTLYPQATLAIYWFDTDQETWVALPSVVDENAHTVTAAVTTLGTFALSAAMPEETNPPGISITSPAPGAALSGSTTITADAWDDNGVASVQFYLGDLLLDTDVAGSDGWSCTFDASRHPPGAYVIAAVAKDACGNEGRAQVSVTLAGGAPAPTLTITSPLPGATAAGALNAAGAWSDDEAPLMVVAMLGEMPLPLPALAENGTWSLTADISGMTPGMWPLTISGRDAADNPVSTSVTVVVPLSLMGQVRARGTGANIEGATVEAYLGGELKGATMTGANGIYQMGGLAAGAYTAVAHKQGYVAQSKASIAVAAGQATYINFNLDLSGKLMGQVREKGTSANVEGATVVARSAGIVRATATTDANGIYTMGSDLPAGTYTVAVSKAGYVTQMKTGIAVTAGATTYVNFLAFERVPAIMGQVRAVGTGANLAGATVGVFSGETSVASATTDANGIYKIPAGLGAGTYTVVASAAGYVRQEKWNVAVTDGQTTYVNFNLAVSGKLMGQVWDKVGGQSIIGATVSARSGGVVRATGTTVGPYGVYQINSDLRAGTYTMLCTAPGYQDFGRLGIVVTAGNTTYVNFPLQPK